MPFRESDTPRMPNSDVVLRGEQQSHPRAKGDITVDFSLREICELGGFWPRSWGEGWKGGSASTLISGLDLGCHAFEYSCSTLETREDARAMTWIPSEYYILVVSDFALAVVVCKFALCLSPELGSFEATAATFSQVDEEHLLQWRLSLREVLPPNDLSQLLWRKTL